MSITMQERTRQFLELQAQELELQERKGRDYGEEENGLKNLERRGVEGVRQRMEDKMARLESLLKPGRVVQVSDESVEDTLMDISNYANLLIILIRSQKEKQ